MVTTTKALPPPLQRASPLCGFDVTTDGEGALAAWAVSDDDACWLVEAQAVPVGSPEVAGWLENPAQLKVTCLDPAQWAALAASGCRPQGVLDIGLAVELLAAGLLREPPTRGALAQVLGTKPGGPTGCPDDPEFAITLARLWDPIVALLDTAGLRWTALVETAAAPWLMQMATKGLPVDGGLWRHALEQAQTAVATLPTVFATATAAPRRLDGASAVRLDRPEDVRLGFARIGAPVRPVRARQLATAAAAAPPGRFRAAAEAYVNYRRALTVTQWAACTISDGRLRGTWRQLGTVTGRASVGHPNLHAMPAELRSAVCAPSGSVLVAGDYGSQDIRVLAALSGDRRLLADVVDGDPYEAVAADAGVGRTLAKQALLSAFYGAAAEGLAERLARPIQVARRLVGSVRARYETAWAFLEGSPPVRVRLPEPLAVLTGEHGDVLEARAAGRRRMAPLPADAAALARHARACRNFRVQGPSATMGKLALVAASRGLREAAPDARLVHFVTDELVVEAPVDQATAATGVLDRAMTLAHERVAPGAPPLVNVTTGASWADTKP